MEIIFLWCLTPLSTIFQLYPGSSLCVLSSVIRYLFAFDLLENH